MLSRKHKRQLELGIVALGLSSLALLYIVIAIGIYMAACNDDVTGRALSSRPAATWDHRPNVSHCVGNDDVEIWDCIRNNPKPSPASDYRAKMRREDI